MQKNEVPNLNQSDRNLAKNFESVGFDPVLLFSGYHLTGEIVFILLDIYDKRFL